LFCASLKALAGASTKTLSALGQALQSIPRENLIPAEFFNVPGAQNRNVRLARQRLGLKQPLHNRQRKNRLDKIAPYKRICQSGESDD